MKGLCLGQEEYNHVGYSKARTPEQEVQYAWINLERRGFHVHTKENYLAEDNTRYGQEVQFFFFFFFFCNSTQILFARMFASQFIVIPPLLPTPMSCHYQ